MTLWHNVSVDLPAMAVDEYEEGGVVYEFSTSAPQLVLLEDETMAVAFYEEDPSFDFHAWVEVQTSATLTGVKCWTQLPKPPKEGKR